MIKEPMLLTGTMPDGFDCLSYRIAIALSDTGHEVAAIRIGLSTRLVTAPSQITDAATAEALAAVTKIVEDR